MLGKTLILALAASTVPLVAGHGKVAVVTGDLGGNGTGIGIQGGIVPGAGRNSVTEVDTTVFRSVDIATDGLGRTTGNGKNQVDDVAAAMALSGETLPQLSGDGNGTLSGTFHIVTDDGAGPLRAMLDTTATGAFSTGVELDVVKQIPGNKGNIKANRQRGLSGLWTRANSVIMRRAANVNEDYPMAFSVPAGTACTGKIGDKSNVCLVKIANANKAGPFGGVVAVQIAPAGAGVGAGTGAGAGSRRRGRREAEDA